MDPERPETPYQGVESDGISNVGLSDRVVRGVNRHSDKVADVSPCRVSSYVVADDDVSGGAHVPPIEIPAEVFEPMVLASVADVPPMVTPVPPLIRMPTSFPGPAEEPAAFVPIKSLITSSFLDSILMPAPAKLTMSMLVTTLPSDTDSQVQSVRIPWPPPLIWTPSLVPSIVIGTVMSSRTPGIEDDDGRARDGERDVGRAVAGAWVRVDVRILDGLEERAGSAGPYYW